jgi:DNA oxidative demethylase
MTGAIDVGGVTVWPGWLSPEAQIAMAADIRAVVASAPLYAPETPCRSG